MARSSSTINLQLSNRQYVSGEAVSGYADLIFPLSHDDGLATVKIVLCGEVLTSISYAGGRSSLSGSYFSEAVSFLKAEHVLWTRSASYPPADSPSLRLPFELSLPDALPPSFRLLNQDCKADLVYSVELVGERPSRLKRNSTIRQVLTIVPAGDAAACDIAERLRTSFGGPWRTHIIEKKVRIGLWSAYSHVKAELILPELAAFPVSTRIPFRLTIMTSTKPMKRKPLPVDIDNKPLFPAPPSHTSIDLRLNQRVHVKAKGEYEVRTEAQVPLGGFGADQPSGNLRVIVEDPIWVGAPGDKEKADEEGIWRRVVRYSSHFTLDCAPTFSTKTLSCEYFLSIRVPFPGMSNDLRGSYPVKVVSSVQARPPSYTNATGPYSGNVLPPPPFLDSEPAYWEASSNPNAD